jgi:predicted RNase H-like nuclease (RuvC/YqgF family)
LQQELATLVSPEQYRAMEERVQVLEARNNRFAAEQVKLEHEIEERTKIARRLKKKVDRFEVGESVWRDEEARSREANDAKDAQIEKLQRMLRERTRDVLALERVFEKQREAATAAALTPLINPAFLGM